MASVVSSVLQRIHPCCNTRAPSPESLQNIIHSHHHRSPSLFLNEGNVYANHTKPALRGRLGVKIGVTAATQNVLFISSALSASRDEFNSLSTAQNRGQGWRTNWNSTEEKEKRAHRRKIKLIHRSFQRELRGGNSRSSFFSVSVFPPHRQRIAVGDPSLPIQELLSPPCVRMMTKAQGVKFTTVKLQLPTSTIKINLLVGKAFCKNRYCTKATLKGMFVEPKLIQGISRFSSSTTSYRFQTIISH